MLKPVVGRKLHVLMLVAWELFRAKIKRLGTVSKMGRQMSETPSLMKETSGYFIDDQLTT